MLVSLSARLIYGLPDYARLCGFSVADDARFVDVFAGKADVGGCGFAVPVQNGNVLSIIRPGNLTPLLSRVVLVG
jgi:hypothetical protein